MRLCTISDFVEDLGLDLDLEEALTGIINGARFLQFF
jgi:hypothetical protein